MQHLSTPLAGALAQMAANSLAHLFFTLDCEQRYTSLDGRLLTEWGINPADILGKKSAEVSGLLANPAHVDAIALALKGDNVACHWETEGPGRHKSFVTTAAPFKDEHGRFEGVVGVVRVVTAQRQTERALRDAHAQLNTLVQSLPVAVIGLNHRGEVVIWTHEAERMFGWTAAEVMGKRNPAIDRHEMPDLPRVRELVSAGGTASDIAMKAHCKDGSLIDISLSVTGETDEHGRPYRMVMAALDVTERLRAERERAKAERQYRETLENLDMLAIMCDRDGRITFCNAFYLQVTGWGRDEVIGQNWYDLFYEPIGGNRTRQEVVERFRDGQIPTHHTGLLPTRTGEMRQVRWNVTVLRDEDGRLTGTASIGEDVTARLAAEATVREKERQLVSLFANLPGMAYRHDPNQPGPALLSEGAEELTGYDTQTLSSEVPYLSLIVPEDYDRVRAAMREAVAARRPFAQEYRIRHRDGSVRWVWERGEGIFDEKGQLEAVAGFIWNVTERKEAEEQIRRSRDFYLAVLEHFPGMVWKSGRDARCDYFNQTWLEFTGRTLQEECDTGWKVNIHPDDQAHSQAVYHAAFAEQRPFTSEYRLRHAASGEYRWVVDRGEPFYDQEGRFMGYLGFCYDNTYRKQAAESLRKYQLLVSLTSDAVLFFRGETGQIVEANRAAEEVYGYSRTQLLQLNVTNLLMPGSRVLDYHRVLASAEEVRLEATHRRADGTPFSVDISVVGTQIGDDMMMAAIVRDISVRQRRDQVQRLLRSLDERILQSQPLEQILRIACTELVSIFDAPLVWIGVPDPDGSVRQVVMVGPLAEKHSVRHVRWDDTPEGNGPAGKAIRTGRIQVAALTDCAVEPWQEPVLELGVKHIIALPLLVEGQPKGTLCLYSARTTPFDEEVVVDLTGFAVQMGLSMEHASQLQQIRLQSAALSAVARAVMITTRDGVIEWVNPAFTALTGYTPEEAIGQTPRLLKSGLQTDTYYSKLWATILAGHVWQGLARNKRKDGSIYVEEMTITPFRDATGQISHFVAIKHDITERRREQERIEHLASHDPLTGLANRRGLDQRMGLAIEAARAEHSTSALVMIDLDRFKPVNDTVGHIAGDRLLVELAQIMTRVVRGDDNIARLGGDEFGIVLDNVNAAQAQEVAERLRAAVDGFRFRFGDHAFAVSASMGIAIIDGTVSIEQVVSRADSALYEAKQEGRNRVVVWQAEGQ